MRWRALEEKAGAYEIRTSDEVILGGIVIDSKNHGVGFMGDASANRFLFDYEDGMIHKAVKVFANDKNNLIGTVKLGFTDTGTLTTPSGTYEWKVIGSSKIWTDAGQNAVMFLDLEGDTKRSIPVLVSDNLDAGARELLTLCGWYLTVVEYRAGFSNGSLAGMPVKTDEFLNEVRKERDTNRSTYGGNTYTWWELILIGLG